MSDELHQNQIECDNIQKSFDEYVESSKELESELEIALEEAEAKITELTKKKIASDDRAKDLNDRLGQTSKEFSKCQSDLIIARENETKADELKRLLEVANEDLNNKVRILEATEEDLKHKLSNMEEDIVFLQGDLQGMDNVKIEIEEKMNREIAELKNTLEEEKRINGNAKSVSAVVDDNSDLLEALTNEMNKAIEALQVELSEANKRFVDADAQNCELLKTVESLQTELNETVSRSTEAEAQNNELMEELTKVTEEVVTLQDTIRQTTDRLVIAKKSVVDERAVVAQLRLEVDALSAELVASKTHTLEVLVNTKEKINEIDQSADVSELRSQLAAQETLMAELREQTATFIEISMGEKQQLEAEMTRRVDELLAEIESLKSSSVVESSSSAVELQMSAQIDLLTREVAALRTNPVALTSDSSVVVVETTTVSRLPKPVAKLPIALSNPLVFSAATLSSASGMSAQAAALIATGDVTKLGSELLRVVGEYESIRRSNAKLLAKLQSLQGNIQVCCRPRPPTEQELSQGRICVDVADDSELMCYDGRVEAWKSFMFDRVWRFDCGQAEVFADVEPMIVSVVDGYNVCIMAYGQTGSGKTFTMDGYGDQFGVSYRTIQKLFDLLNFKRSQLQSSEARGGPNSVKTKPPPGALSKATLSRKLASGSSLDLTASGSSSQLNSPITSDMGSGKFTRVDSDLSTTDGVHSGDLPGIAAYDEVEDQSLEGAEGFSFSVEISMMEIYNEQVFDLLHHETGGGQSDGVSLDIRQGPDNVVSVPGLKQAAVASIEEVMAVFSKGTANRATSSTNLNEHSSRSHLIILVEVTTRVGTESSVKGKLHLVDLAGSERVGKSGVTGAAMKEAQYINKSLSALGDVMEALDQKSKHVPYRNSKLTYLLQNSLGGNSRTMMIVTVCPTDLTFDESLFTLQFATRVRNITTGPAVKNSNAKNLELSLKTVKAELKETKRKKQLLEEAISDSKKELKKAGERVAVPETKLKALEDAKVKADTLLSQLAKQLNETTFALGAEKESREQAVSDLAAAKTSLKKAQEGSKEHAKENERLQLVTKARERENEKLRAQINKLETQEALVGKRERSPAKLTSDPLSTPVNSAAKSSSSLTSSTRLEGYSHGGISDLSMSPMLKANALSSFQDDPPSYSSSNSNSSSSKSKAAPVLGSYAHGTASSMIRTTTAMGPPVTTTVSSSTKTNGGVLDGGPSRVRNHSLSAIPQRRSTSVSRSPYHGESNGTNSVHNSAEKRSSLSDAPPAYTPNGSVAPSSANSSSKIPSLSARSEEALKRHQARMDKKRELMAADNR